MNIYTFLQFVGSLARLHGPMGHTDKLSQEDQWLFCIVPNFPLFESACQSSCTQRERDGERGEIMCVGLVVSVDSSGSWSGFYGPILAEPVQSLKLILFIIMLQV